MKGVGGPLGRGDFEKGRRVEFLLDQAPRLWELGCVPAFELKGDDLSGGWVEALREQLGSHGLLTWHWSPKATKGLGEGVLSSQLVEMAVQANELRQRIGLAAVTIHCAPAMAIEPDPEAGWERYDSPVSASEMLAHLLRQVGPLRHLNLLCGGILSIETVDVANFRDVDHKVPTYLALQTGSWLDLIWLAEQAGVWTTFDSEHHLCSGNLLLRRRELESLPRQILGLATSSEELLASITGYWLRRGAPPEAKLRLSLPEFIQAANPRLYHLGAAVQATNEAGEICTHLPYIGGLEETRLLDWQLISMMSNPHSLGAVTEVTGQLFVEDPVSPGQNRYSQWSARPDDDEVAKEQTILAIIDRLEAINRLS